MDSGSTLQLFPKLGVYNMFKLKREDESGIWIKVGGREMKITQSLFLANVFQMPKTKKYLSQILDTWIRVCDVSEIFSWTLTQEAYLVIQIH